MEHTHFKNKDPLHHVLDKRAEGVNSFSETHGAELPGHLSAGADAARETALVLLLLTTALTFISTPYVMLLKLLVTFFCAWLAWKTGRSAWLGWARLERFHRLVEQEKYEIEHNRAQEQEELKALYRAKGFEGPLLDEVVAVLMADENRLLKVMVEEELGLTLHTHEHPLKQAWGAALGTFTAGLCCFIGVTLFPPLYGMLIASLIVIGGASLLSARHEKNAWIPAVVWTLSLGTLAFGMMHFILKMLI